MCLIKNMKSLYSTVEKRAHGCPSYPCFICASIRWSDVKTFLRVVQGRESLPAMLHRGYTYYGLQTLVTEMWKFGLMDKDGRLTEKGERLIDEE
jgi:hypothetical protein